MTSSAFFLAAAAAHGHATGLLAAEGLFAAACAAFEALPAWVALAIAGATALGMAVVDAVVRSGLRR